MFIFILIYFYFNLIYFYFNCINYELFLYAADLSCGPHAFQFLLPDCSGELSLINERE
jgi:hypothetical protein